MARSNPHATARWMAGTNAVLGSATMIFAVQLVAPQAGQAVLLLAGAMIAGLALANLVLEIYGFGASRAVALGVLALGLFLIASPALYAMNGVALSAFVGLGTLVAALAGSTLTAAELELEARRGATRTR